MNLIQIVRNRKLSTPESTYSTISFNGVLVGFGVEQPWRDNLKGHSCLPEGDYELHLHNSAKHGAVVAFHNPSLNIYAEPNLIPVGVDGRSSCLIHSANFSSELEGCYAPGQDYLYNTKHQPIGVSNSKVTLEKLQKYWGNRSNIEASIIWV